MFTIASHKSKWELMPRDKRLELMGLYLQYCFGDFGGWSSVSGTTWKSEMVENQVENYAVNAESQWKQYRGLTTQEAIARLNQLIS